MSFSMTGYGQAVLHYGGYKVQFEIKSVNHRYCEVMLRIPREWTRFEDGLRKTVQRQVKRGRVDVFISKEVDLQQGQSAVLNEALVQAYLKAGDKLRTDHGVQGQLTVADLLSLPDILHPPDGGVPEEEMEAWETVLQQGLTTALEGMLDMRRREGRHLAEDLGQRLQKLEQILAEMTVLAPTVVQDYRNKLRQRLNEMQDSFTIDEHRLGMEIALFADRCNIDEELTRLQSHFAQCSGLLTSSEPIGRKLDFLIQEMNREVNTVGSKANHLVLVNLVVDMKAELEKIREQAANIE
ncbi:YicC/YloC family endoribonuclease [Paenibacillus sp. JX-17]|uniref:YicC/YloC family endoribonuclease n=1 Tax=Paenibacillus lacisoli TaxID=3064525 RepID=A0ABT9C7L3_9BACL|nr:YicC/YloC family endoribonuclease [Paenibacillus sp. JX-17]MDO7905255.1 YicC/YloC family endoribonuclease [Paenibacillus sp. JX-17]